jgi:hypothetical protein
MDAPAEFFKLHGRKNRLKVDPFILPVNNQMELRPEPALPWFPVDLPDFPNREILAEAQGLSDLYVEHRDDQGHKGWKSLCIHGISARQTGIPEDYGLAEDQPGLYKWTEIAERCPTSVAYFRERFPAEGFRRVRFMQVEAGGYIQPHRDRDRRSLGPLTICLNSPGDCLFGIEGHGLIPFQAGQGMLVDISYRHSVWNRSAEDRYHIIVEIVPGARYREYIDLVMATYRRRAGLRRHFVSAYRRYLRSQV